MRHPRIAEDSGTSLIELAMSLLITSLMSASLIAWIGSAGTAAGLHSADDEVVQDLRVAKEHITRDLRIAREVLVAQTTTVSVWVDGDEDEYRDPGETVTWAFSDGSLTRRTDLTEPISEVANLDAGASRFTYDAVDVAEVAQVQVTLVGTVSVGTVDPSQRSLTVAVHVRNVP
ncbi:MAG TPA: hypothetical protein VGB41_03630 [Acidimicrobiia bacterium]